MTADERLALIQVKTERAKEHIGDLDSAMSIFHNGKPYEFSTKRDPQTRQLIYYMSKVDCVPMCFATITGDIIQNLRSALDHLAQQLFLVGTSNPRPGRHTSFLIEQSAGKYKTRLPRRTKGMRQDAISALSAIEPYKGGKGHEFWVLHELNNIDKHRLLVTVGSTFQGINVAALGPARIERLIGSPVPSADVFLIAADNPGPLKVGNKLFIDAPDAEVNEKMDFRFDIALSEPGVIDGKPLLETVQHFHDLVSDTVLRFKPCLA
jgi:hypothetical protein